MLWPISLGKSGSQIFVTTKWRSRAIRNKYTTGKKYMSKIKTILSIIFIFTIWGCVSSAYPILWWSRECVLYLIIIIKPEVWIINHCLGLGHETMVCAVCLTMFLWICDMTRLLRGTFHVLVVFAPNLVLCHLTCSITILLGTLLMSDT